MHFLYPVALFGLLAVPALVAIYWLRNRSRIVPVSSLMLWLDQSEIQHGGIRLRRLQTPLLFYIELLALILLALAAAGPQLRTAQSSQSLVVILDDSYSMLAGGEASARKLGFAALRQELASGNWFAVRCLIAGPTPTLLDSQTLGRVAQTIDEKWTCRAPHADLDSAINFAAEIGGKHSALLVLSDRKPTLELPEGRVRWWAFGAPRGNIAFVNAARGAQSGTERVLLEIANFAPKEQTTQLLLSDDADNHLHRAALTLAPRETRRLTLRLDESKSAAVIRARVQDATLEIDNAVSLVRPEDRPIRVHVSIQDDKLRPIVERVLEATKRITLTATTPELVITDASAVAEKERAGAWVLRFVADKDAESFLGPFVMDRAHPLNDGLSLNGVIWGAGKGGKTLGTPVISVGSTPLVSDLETSDGAHDIQVRLRPDLSTLLESPQWAVFIWNLVQWRAGQLDGLVRSNVRLGEPGVLKTKAEGELKVTYPDKLTQKKSVTGRQVTVPTEQVGLYRIEADKKEYLFACNALHPEESDLQDSVDGKWGEWSQQTAPTSGVESLSWLLVLIVALLLTVHLWLARK